jgi:hypothetical protein
MPAPAASSRKSARRVRSSPAAADALVLAARVVRNATSASPMASGSMVAAVRRGWRAALPAASAPATPATRRIGAASRRASDHASAGPRASTPSAMAAVPASRKPLSTGSARAPASTRPAPATARAAPARVRPRPTWPRASTSPRRAGTGGTRPARRAGPQADTSAVPTPTARATATVRGATRVAPVTSATASSVDRSSTPKPAPSPTPRTSPATEATTPRIEDSTRTERRSWARLAPRHRSRASSRAREARTMPKLLRISNMPVSSATTPARKKSWVSPPSVGVALRARSAASSAPVNSW